MKNHVPEISVLLLLVCESLVHILEEIKAFKLVHLLYNYSISRWSWKFPTWFTMSLCMCGQWCDYENQRTILPQRHPLSQYTLMAILLSLSGATCIWCLVQTNIANGRQDLEKQRDASFQQGVMFSCMIPWLIRVSFCAQNELQKALSSRGTGIF